MSDKFDSLGLALKDCEVTVYMTDDSKIYIGSMDIFVKEGEGLPNNSYIEKPPKDKKGFAIARVNNYWKQIEDNRGLYYSTLDGSEIIVDKLGPLPNNLCTVPRPGANTVWNGEKWIVEYREPQKETVDDSERIAVLENALIKLSEELLVMKEKLNNGK